VLPSIVRKTRRWIQRHFESRDLSSRGDNLFAASENLINLNTKSKLLVVRIIKDMRYTIVFKSLWRMEKHLLKLTEAGKVEVGTGFIAATERRMMNVIMCDIVDAIHAKGDIRRGSSMAVSKKL
jgi:hypothetical protein